MSNPITNSVYAFINLTEAVERIIPELSDSENAKKLKSAFQNYLESLDAQIDSIHGPGAAKAIEVAYTDGYFNG